MKRHPVQTCFEHRAVKLVAGLLIAIFILHSAGGCTPTARHKFLTVVFTGVPPLEGEAAEDADPLPVEIPLSAEQLRREKHQVVTDLWVHGPYGAKQCQHCHDFDESTNIRSKRRRSFSSISASIEPQQEYSLKQLCVGCHASHSSSYAEEHSLSMHEPSVAGICTVCHRPHQARRQFMLLGEDNRELCTRCHEPAGIKLVGAHANNPGADCISCHNAHVGTTTSLLKSTDDELALLYQLDGYEGTVTNK